MDHPHHTNPWKPSFQQEVAAWARKNFGECLPWQPYAGLQEEVAEFLDPGNGPEEWADAIGDQCIYAANLCQMLGIDFDELVFEPAQSLTHRELMGALGLGWRAILKHSQGIRGYNDDKRKDEVLIALIAWMRWAKWECHALGIKPPDFHAMQTWAKVSKRDWVAHPTDAHSHA